MSRSQPGRTPGRLADGCGIEGRLVTRTRERYAAIHELLQAGESLHAVSRILSLSRPAVRRFARAASADELMDGATGKESKLDSFKPCIHQRRNEGVTDAAALYAELQQRGFAGSVRTVRRHVAPFRQAAAPDPAPAVPRTRQITRWLLSRPEHLKPEEQARLDAIRASCPHINALAGHVASFAEMMTNRTGDRDLKAWLATVEADDGQPELRSFATGIRNDQQAVTNGLTLPYSSGKVEGTVNMSDENDQAADVRARRIRPAPHPRHPSPSVTTKFAAEPQDLPVGGHDEGTVVITESERPGCHCAASLLLPAESVCRTIALFKRRDPPSRTAIREGTGLAGGPGVRAG